MADDDTLPVPDPPAEVPLTKANIPELVKAVVVAVEKSSTGTLKPPSKYPLIASVHAHPFCKCKIV